MKRDLDLIKLILLEYEKLPPPPHDIDEIEVSNYSEDEIIYHQKLLLDDDYIIGEHFIDIVGEQSFYPERLTNKGHDFLEKIKNDTAWNKTKATILEKGGGFALDIVNSLITAVIKAQLGL
ncbi:MAG: DUF2513 domain-containing protein [Anaerolineaceae bacterium]|jgi:hypothetical protein